MAYLTRTFLTLSLVLFSSAVALAQSPAVDGVASFKNGDFNAAIQKLKDSKDPVELSFLGQAYEAVKNNRDAGKAYERSFKSGYAVFEKTIQQWVASTPKSTLNVALAPLDEVIRASISSADSAIRLKSGIANDNEWRVKAKALLDVKRLEIAGEQIHPFALIDARPRIVTFPRPAFTSDPCRKPDLNEFTIRLWTIYHADGQTLSVIPRSKWIRGCSEAALIAVREMKFEPGQSNGEPVTVMGLQELSFSTR
jgi:hypothetical protein